MTSHCIYGTKSILLTVVSKVQIWFLSYSLVTHVTQQCGLTLGSLNTQSPSPASGPPCVLFPIPGMLFSGLFARLPPPRLPGFSLNAICSEKPSPNTRSEVTTIPFILSLSCRELSAALSLLHSHVLVPKAGSLCQGRGCISSFRAVPSHSKCLMCVCGMNIKTSRVPGHAQDKKSVHQASRWM